MSIPIQLHQNINLLIFLILGKVMANLSMDWGDIIFIVLFTILVEHIFLYFNPNRDFYLSYSAISTAIGVIILIYSTSIWHYLIAIFLGLFQKHYISIEKKHLFNPSNLSIIMTLLLFYKDAHVILGQFGDEVWLNMIVFLLAIIMLIRVDRWIISLTFVISYILLTYFLLISYDPVLSFEMVYRKFYSISLMLFIYFMLTDPMVTPSKPIYQIVFGFLVALLIVFLDRIYGFRVQHFFMSVAFLSPFITYLKSKRGLKEGMIFLLVMAFITTTIFVIQQKPPYYFEMNG